jgi:Type II secretion system (T2SS), protein E, N-terminal domain
MPLLTRRTVEPGFESDEDKALNGARGLLLTCGNRACRSGWLHLWRSRSGPVFEGGWNCSSDCTAERVAAAVRREMDVRGTGPQAHRHRVPLGLLMMEQGWITADQLREALRLQRESGCGRLGFWLISRCGVSEQKVARALGLQWSCPVLPLESHDPEALSSLMPRLFIDAFGALPLRVAAGRLLYVGFEDRVDPVLCLALERMTGLRVEGGLVRESQFKPAHERMLRASFPSVQLIEAVSEPVLVRSLAKVIEKARPAEAKLVRLHDCLWLRMWKKAAGPRDVEDILSTIAPQ